MNALMNWLERITRPSHPLKQTTDGHMKQLTVSVGTRITIKTNPALGVCTIDKIGQRIDEFGDKHGPLCARYKDKQGITRGCTPLSMLTDEWFEIC